MGLQLWPGVANQERFLLSEAATGVRALLPVTYDIHGPLDVGLLVQTIERLIAKHAMLRARARLDNPKGCLIEIAPIGIPVIFQDLSNLTTHQQTNTHVQILKEAMEDHDGRFRAFLVELGPHHHALTIIPHHAVVDGVSINAIVDQISNSYNNFGIAPVPETAALETFFSKFRAVESGGESHDYCYWKNYLEDLPEQPKIPSARYRSGDAVDQTGYIIHPIEMRLHEATRALARRNRARTFTLYLNAVMIALARLTGEPDLAVTIQSAGRRAHGLSDDVIGMFSKALILRSPHVIQATAERLQTIDRDISTALAHEAAPYHDVIRYSGATPRYALNWFPPHSGLQLNGCTAQERIVVPWPTTFDINLHVVKTEKKVELRVFHNLSQVDHKIADHLGALVRSLLEQMVANPGATTDQLNSPGSGPVGQADPARLALPRLEQTVRARAAKALDAPAICHSDGALNYRALIEAVDRLAARIPEGARVAVIGHRGPGVVIGALAALQSRGAFVLIDPCYPAERIQAIIEQIDPHVLLMGTPLLADLEQIVDEQTEPGNVTGIERFILRSTARDHITDKRRIGETAYYLFTSGSTGVPKGISSDHAPLAYAIDWQAKTFDIDDSIRCAFLAGIGHDPALRDIFLPLSLGGTLVSPDPARLFEPGYLSQWLRDEEISLAHLTPSMIRLIATGAGEYPCPMLRHVFVGGEQVDTQIVDAIRKIAPNAQVINVYGTSETPQIVICATLPNREPITDPIPIGRPRPDVAAHLIDSRGRACGFYEPGEIWIETPYMSNGYLDPEQTRKVFQLSPGLQGQGLYHTGDIGYVTPEKEIILLGRTDDQVKIRGYRIELGEVESALRTVAAPHVAAVVARFNETSDSLQLIGFIDSRQGMPDETALKTRMKTYLPGYMIPDRIIPLQGLPLLPTGKIDRRTLSEMPLPAAPQAVHVEPITETERQLVLLWKRVLNVSSIGIDDSFFNLGGDSLTAVRLMLEMERAGVDATVGRAIMRGATIREIAAGHKTAEGTCAPASIPPGSLLSRMSIHVLRGFLVLLIVAGHWMPGLIERIPVLAGVHPILTPIFNLSTPGFAIIFGVSLGYFMYETYQNRRGILQRQIRLGASVLIAAMSMISVMHLAQGALLGERIGGHEIAMSFYNVLGFYLLAVLSVPLWFAIVEQSPRPWFAIVSLLAAYCALDLLMRHLFLPYEPKGFAQLIRLYATAKFSYFNMSIGALMGLGLGLAIRHNVSLPLDRKFTISGTILLMIGVAWGAATGQLEELLTASSRIDYWKWCLYGGVIALLSGVIWPIVSAWGECPDAKGLGLRFLGSVGVLALPFFVFHDLILSVKSLLDALGIPDFIGLVAVLLAFFGIGGWATAKVWRIYYGNI